MVTCIFGLPGCGKSTVLTAIAQIELKKIIRGKSKYKRVYTTHECAGALRITGEDILNYDFRDCLILIDEITLLWDNRGFKTFPQRVKEFFTLHRHYNIDVIYATQYYKNVDKRIRDVTAVTYYILKGMFISKLVKCPIRVLFPEETGEIVVGHTKPGIVWQLVGRRFIRARWFKYFDSWEREYNVKTLPASSYKGIPRWAVPMARRSHWKAFAQEKYRKLRFGVLRFARSVLSALSWNER